MSSASLRMTVFSPPVTALELHESLFLLCARRARPLALFLAQVFQLGREPSLPIVLRQMPFAEKSYQRLPLQVLPSPHWRL
jgi:hypothetical protein